MTPDSVSASRRGSVSHCTPSIGTKSAIALSQARRRGTKKMPADRRLRNSELNPSAHCVGRTAGAFCLPQPGVSGFSRSASLARRTSWCVSVATCEMPSQPATNLCPNISSLTFRSAREAPPWFSSLVNGSPGAKAKAGSNSLPGESMVAWKEQGERARPGKNQGDQRALGAKRIEAEFMSGKEKKTLELIN